MLSISFSQANRANYWETWQKFHDRENSRLAGSKIPLNEPSTGVTGQPNYLYDIRG